MKAVCVRRKQTVVVFIDINMLFYVLLSSLSEEDMKVAANFVLRFQQPEEKALRYLSRAISENYLQSMPVYKNTLLRDGTLINKCPFTKKPENCIK